MSIKQQHFFRQRQITFCLQTESSIYVLKKVPRCWNFVLDDHLKKKNDCAITWSERRCSSLPCVNEALSNNGYELAETISLSEACSEPRNWKLTVQATYARNVLKKLNKDQSTSSAQSCQILWWSKRFSLQFIGYV